MKCQYAEKSYDGRVTAGMFCLDCPEACRIPLLCNHACEERDGEALPDFCLTCPCNKHSTKQRDKLFVLCKATYLKASAEKGFNKNTKMEDTAELAVETNRIARDLAINLDLAEGESYAL